MSDGIYILETKDGYRVAYYREYDDFFGSYDDNTLNYPPNSAKFKYVFGQCTVHKNSDDALSEAFQINKKYDEPEYGIMFIKNYRNMTFEELVNGNAA